MRKCFWIIIIVVAVSIGLTFFSCGSRKGTNDQSLPKNMTSSTSTSEDVSKNIPEGKVSENVGEVEGSAQRVMQSGGRGESSGLVPITRYPEAGREFRGELILVFPEEVYFPEEVFPEEYVRCTPPLKGSAECIGNMLICKLIEPMPDNISQIEICVNPKLQSKSGNKISSKAQCYKFSREVFKVINSWFEDVSSEYYEIGLRFNRYISGERLSKYIQVADFHGNKVEWSLNPSGKEEVLSFNLRVKRSPNDLYSQYKLIISPGYSDMTGTLKGERFYLEFPSKESLKVTTCDMQSDSVIHLCFDKPVAKDSLLRNLKLELEGSLDKVEFNITPDNVKYQSVSSYGEISRVSKEWYVSIDKRSIGERQANFVLTLSPETWSRNMAFLGAEFRKNLKWIKEQVRLPESSVFPGFSWSYWQNAGLNGPICVVWCNALPSVEEINKHLVITPEVSNLKVSKIGDSLRIYGDWKTNERYIIKLTAGMKFILREAEDKEEEKTGELVNDYEFVLSPVPMYKALDFFGKDKFYFLPYGDKNYIRIGGRNVRKGYVHLYRVIPENLSYWVGNLSDLNQISIDVNERTTDYIGMKEIAFDDAWDKTQYIDVNLEELVSNVGKRGLFTIYLSESPERNKVKFGEEESYLPPEFFYDEESEYEGNQNIDFPTSSGIRYFVWTRIGVVIQWDGKSILGFVHDLVDLSPIVGAEVFGYSVKGREVGKTITNDNGLFRLSDLREEPKVIIVRALDDFTFLLLNPKPLPSMKDLEKYERFGKNKIDAFVYTDRNIYRPGETIHARWIVRKNYGIELVDTPLELRVINPMNRVILQKLVNLSDFGTGGEDILTEGTFLTGAYSLGLYIPGGERLCGSTRVNLEDFVPDRIKVEASIDNKNWVVGRKYQIGVKANYYVGPPGANLKCEGKVLVYKADILEDKFPGYRFTNSEPYLTYLENLSEQFTDEQGRATYSYEFQPKNVPTCPVEVVVRMEVSESGGRAVGAMEKAIGYLEDILCGVGIETSGNKVRANVVLVDTEFNIAPDEEVEVSLGTLEWTYVNRVLSTYPRRVVPQWQERFVLSDKKIVRTNNGKAVVEFEIPPGYRNYRLRARRVSGKMFSEVSFYSMWNGVISVKDGPPELVKVVVEDKKWNIGDEIPVVIQCPFDGKAFVVIQGEELWDSKIVDLKDGRGEFKFEVKPEYFPNVWVAVNAIPAKLEEKVEISPYSSYTFKNISIDDKTRSLKVEIVGLPANIMPRSKLEFDVFAKGENGEQIESEITVAIVDEGIHSILGYITPDPYNWFRRDRYNPFLWTQYYENVAYEYKPESPSGDMIARQLSAGKPNITESWIKPFALWSGAVRTDKEGRAHLEFLLPEFNGKARVVVVGTSVDKVGSMESSLDIKRPCIIQSQLPRFLRPGDKALIFARGLNTLQNSVIVTGDISSQGGKLSRNLIEWEVPSNGIELSPYIEIQPEGFSRGVELTWRYKVRDRSGMNLDEFSDETKIPVYLSSVYKRKMKTYVVKPGETLEVENSNLPESSLMHSEICVGGALALRLVPIYEWLNSYPYGCAEQKLSKLYAMYIMRKYFLIDVFKDTGWKDVRLLFLSLLNSIFACQHSSGGIGFWPYSNEPNIKVSLHAGFLLASMRRFSELPIPEKHYIALMNYIRNFASDTGKGSNDVKAYATMVLALDGDPVACESLVKYLSKNRGISWELRTLIKYVVSICKGTVENISIDEVDGDVNLEEEPNNEVSEWELSRTKILMTSMKLLNALLSNKSDNEILQLQLQLFDLISDTNYLSTYDLPFVLIALEESTKKFGKPEGIISGEIKINDEVYPISSTTMKKEMYGKVRVEVKNTGEAPIYLTTLFGELSTGEESEKENPDYGVVVRRYVCDKNGIQVGSNEFKQGELYYLVYSIEPKYNLEGFVLSQLLPAGMELENPRFYDERFISALEKIGDKVESLVKPEHVEIRDDKMIIACPYLNVNSKVGYICAVRAVTPGEFEFPGFLAEDLYKPQIKASSSKERIYIK